MRKLAAFAALISILITSCAASLPIAGTTPSTLNDGTCSVPALYPARSPMQVCARADSINGRMVLSDSLLKNPGEPFSFSWKISPGDYRVTAWVRNAAGFSCSTSVFKTLESKPDKAVIQ